MIDLWSPLTQPGEERLQINKAEGIYIYDQYGRKYIDANSGLWNVPLGYSNTFINEAINMQLMQVGYVNSCEFVNESSVRLAGMLKELHVSCIDKIVLTCTGSESIDLIIKFIRKYHALKWNFKKYKIAVLNFSYHGSYYGSMSCSNYDGNLRAGYAPLLDGIITLSIPNCRGEDLGDEEKKNVICTLHEELEKANDELGGVILEPILGSAGVFILPDWYLYEIQEYAAKHDILVAYDEVATGFGRTGNMFRYEAFNIKPDLIAMSKGMNNGILPIGAVGVSKKIVSVFEDKKEIIFHLSTQNGNPVCCASAIATIELLTSQNNAILSQVNKKNIYFMRKFYDNVTSECNRIWTVRNSGLMFAVELTEKDGCVPLAFRKLIKYAECLRKYSLVIEWSYIEDITSCIILFLPFIIEEDEINKIITIFQRSLKILKHL